jgi:hypothetical protein
MKGQMSIFDFLKVDDMYDGYKVIKTATINVMGNRIKINKNDICYLVVKCKDGYVNVAFPDEYGGSLGLPVTEKQFSTLFEKLNRKVYPKSKEIWNGKSWIANPEL